MQKRGPLFEGRARFNSCPPWRALPAERQLQSGVRVARARLEADGPTGGPVLSTDGADEVNAVEPVTRDGALGAEQNRALDWEVVVEDDLFGRHVAGAPGEDALRGAGGREVCGLLNRCLTVEDHVAQVEKASFGLTAVLKGRLIVENQAGIAEASDDRVRA